ncbi:MAG TPA: Gfo/Idh/MocA family oxidoreductase, partial [Tepidisphaeraceae bacterium]|nr:Gfo/Idh/MocA family oxidoreductase [Tepidisphaeraceae bacterium]
MIQLAFVGCAHIHTPGFIRMCKARQDVQVKSVWDHDAARAKQRADELGAVVVEDVKAIFKDPEIKGIIICSETNRHKALAIPAARAKKDLFIEKPLGIGAKDAYAVADAVEKAGVIFQTGYFMRGNPMHQFIRQQIEAGAFGKITRMRHSNCHGGALKHWFDTEWRWMADPQQSGVGAFGDLGTHSLDIMIWLLGEVESCTATINNGTETYEDCDETGEALIKFKNGVIGTLAGAWDDLANPVQLLLSGTEGHAAIINQQLYFVSNKVEGADGKEPWTKLPAPWKHAFELWLDAVGGTPDVPLVGAREAAYRSAVMETMYKA